MQTIFCNGMILTMTAQGCAEALLVEDGKIRAVGRLADIQPQLEASAKIMDLSGRTLMPAFIDPHSHFSQVAMGTLQASLDGTDSVDAIGARIADFIKTHHVKPGTWLHAQNYDNNRMPQKKNPTLADLDRFAPQNPLVIHHQSGHMGLLNSLAIKALQLTPETPVAPGGKIEIQDGKLTGYLEENAFFECLKKIPMASPDQLLQGFKDAQEIYLSHGITTVQDGMVVDQMLPLYSMLKEQLPLNIDVVAYTAPDCYQKAVQLFGHDCYDRHIRVGGIKMFLDGSPQGRTAWMRTPYVGTPDYCGYGTMQDAEVLKTMATAAQYDTQLICHCNGDGAAAQYLDCLKQTEDQYPDFKFNRPVLIHGQLIGTDQLPTAYALGVTISFFIAHVFHWGDVHIENFGFERAQKISPAHSALQAHIPFTFHQDAPVIAPDMLETVWCAVNRKTRSGVTLGEDECIGVEDALAAVTKNAAVQYFEEDCKGTLSVGKQADLVILSENPCDVPKDELRRIAIEETYKAGQLVYSAKNPA